MGHEQFGFIAFCIVTFSVLLYVWRILTGKEKDTSITGWAISLMTGAVTFLTYGEMSGTNGNIWIAAIEVVDPALVVVAAAAKRQKWHWPELPEVIAVVLSVVALKIHFVAFTGGADQVAYAAALTADICAAAPVVRYARRHPEKEQPLAWLISIVGTSISFLSITRWTLDQWSLPFYQLLFCFLVFIPAARYRLKCRSPKRQRT